MESKLKIFLFALDILENITKKKEEESKMELPFSRKICDQEPTETKVNNEATDIIGKLLDEIIGNVLPGIDIASKILEDVVEKVVATCEISKMSKKDDFFGQSSNNAPTIHKCTVCGLTYFDRSMFGLHLKSHYAPEPTTTTKNEDEDKNNLKPEAEVHHKNEKPEFSDEESGMDSDNAGEPKSALKEQDKHIPLQIMNKLDGKKCTVCKLFIHFGISRNI